MGAVLGPARASPGGDGLVPAVGEYARNPAPKATPGKHAGVRAPGGTGTGRHGHRGTEPEEGGCRPPVSRAPSASSGTLFGVGKGGKRLY